MRCCARAGSSCGRAGENESATLFRSWTWDPATFTDPGDALTGVEGRWFLPEFDAAGAQPSPPGDSPDWDDNPDIDLFCAHHITLEDGRLLAVGGTKKPPFSKGSKSIFTYDPDSERWEPHSPGMQKGRWYPTAVVLRDGRIAIFSGRPDSGIEETAEILNPETLQSSTISGGSRRLYIYPGMVMVPSGHVFYVPTAWQYEGAGNVGEAKTGVGPTASFAMTGATSGTWTVHKDPTVPTDDLYPTNFLREEGTYVLLPPAQDGRILLIGGGFALDPNDSTAAAQQSTEMDTCEILHTQSGQPRWTPAGRMRRPRSNVHAVVLPDGKVLIVGGHDGAKRVHATDQLIPEMFDPTVPYDPSDPHAAFTDMAPMGASRLYHACALLLPDGRVFVAGGEDNDHSYVHQFGNNQSSFELYEPPYCHQGDQPTITSLDGGDRPHDELGYGDQVRIQSPQAPEIDSVVLMRLGSATHHTDSEQRHVPMNFALTGEDLIAVPPPDPSVAPPGYYMLFIVDDDGRPCEQASIVRLSHRRCQLITDRSTFSVDEMGPGTTTFPHSFYVHLDGFLPSEVAVTSATPTPAQLVAWAPEVAFTIGDGAVAEIRAVPNALHLEDPSLPAGVRQRITFEYTVEITSTSIFPPEGTDRKAVSMRATAGVLVNGEIKEWHCRGTVHLTRQANPYMLDGPTHWLSMDLRVFTVRANNDTYAITTPVTNPTGYIHELISKWTGLPLAGHPFDNLSEDQHDSRLQLAAIEDGEAVYNFAVARVRYRGQTLPATDARVFFRMFATATTNMTFDPGSTYRTHTDGSRVVPLLGNRSGELASIPFFAVPRIDTTASSMEAQPEDLPNKQTLAPTGAGESDTYFGGWLDINQAVGRFPLSPGAAVGPFAPASVLSIKNLINGKHQCLVAELHFAPDPILADSNPATSDNLSQRNLAIEGSDNPGGPAAHTVALTFEIDPTWNIRDAIAERKAMPVYRAAPHGGHDRPVPVDRHADGEVAGRERHDDHDHGEHDARAAAVRARPVTGRAFDELAAARVEAEEAAAAGRPVEPRRALETPLVAYRPPHHAHAPQPVLNWLAPDELMIDWGGLPSGTEAELYIPGLRAPLMHELLARRWAEAGVTVVDDDTLAIPADGGMSHIPLPALHRGPLAALLTVQLPSSVRKRQVFTVRVRQASMTGRKVVGSFELRVPVGGGNDFLDDEQRWLAVLQDTPLHRPPDHRWTPVLERLLKVVRGRVRGFGGDPDIIRPSPEGHDPDPCLPCPDPDAHDHPDHPHHDPDHPDRPGGPDGDCPDHPDARGTCGCTVCVILEALENDQLRRTLRAVLCKQGGGPHHGG